jgi:hypothetical protein
MLTAQLKFGERFYCWAIKDWNREINEDFPFLRSISDAQNDVKIMESLTTAQQKILAVALVKRFTKRNILEQCGNEFTDYEKNLVERHLKMCWDEEERKSLMTPPGGWPPETSERKLKRRKLRDHIITNLTPILGKRDENWGVELVWRHYTVIGPWQVMTYIDVGGQGHQLTYEHSISVSETAQLIEGISVLSWLGIAGQTMWRGLHDADTEPTVEALAKIIAHFMDAAPKLLEGLSPD